MVSETLAFSGEKDGYQRWLQRATPFFQAKDVWDVISSERVASKVISSEERMLGHVTEIVSNENGISVELEVPVTRIQEKLYKLDRAAVVFLNSMFEKVDSVFLRFKPEMKAHEMWRIIKEEYETESTNKIQSASARRPTCCPASPPCSTSRARSRRRGSTSAAWSSTSR